MLGLTGHDWFFVVSAVSDTVIEPRTFPIPVGVQTTAAAGQQRRVRQQPQPRPVADLHRQPRADQGQHRLRAARISNIGVTLALQHQLCRRRRAPHPVRRAVAAAPTASITALGVQEAFVDYHIRNVSDRFDFDSVRVGIQPFNFDFRGFLFQDQQLGIRLFGNRDNNRFQYNIAAIWRLEKDTNSGLNDLLQTPARRLDPARQPVPPGFPVRRPDQPGQPDLQHEPRARRDRGRRQRLPGPPGPDRQSARPQLRRRLSRLQRRRPDRPGQPDRLRLWRCSAQDRDNIFTGQQCRHPALLRRRRAVDRLRLDPRCAAAGALSRAATAIPTTMSSAASTRSSRTRSSPAPTPATGSARPSRSPAAAARSRSTAATASSTRCARRRSRASRTSPIRARCCSASAPISTSRRACASRPTSTISWFAPHRRSLQALRMRGHDPAATSAGTCQRRGDLAAAGDPEHRLPRSRARCFSPARAFATCSRTSNRDRRYYSVLLNAILTYLRCAAASPALRLVARR